MTRQYIEVLNDLKNCVNGKHNKANAVEFLKFVNEFKKDFQMGISTQFLRDLIDNKPNRYKTYKISYFLKKCGVKTHKKVKWNFEEWVLNKSNVDIIEYTHDTRFKVKETEKAFIKNIRNQQIGIESKQHNDKVYHFI